MKRVLIAGLIALSGFAGTSAFAASGGVAPGPVDFCTTLTSVNQLNVIHGRSTVIAVIGTNSLNPTYSFGVQFKTSDPLAASCQTLAIAKTAREGLGNQDVPALAICGTGTLSTIKNSSGGYAVSTVANKLTTCRLFNLDKNI